MNTVYFYSAHFFLDGAVADDFRKLFLKLKNISRNIPDNCSFLLATHLKLRIHWQICLSCPYDIEGDGAYRPQRLIHMKILIFLKDFISGISSVFSTM